MNKGRPGAGKGIGRQRPKADGRPQAILVVDDDAGTRAHIARTLAAKGYSILEAGDGEEALTLSMSRKGPIHLLITDVMMPVMNGKELAERLCSLRPGIHILYVSGYTREEVISDNRNSGSREWWLAKPFTGRQLLAKVKTILEAPPRA